MYTNYAYGVQNQTGTPSANYNLFVTGTNDYTGSTGFMIKNDTTLSGPNKKGTRIFQDSTDNAYLDFRTTATDGAKSFAFRLQDDSSPSTFNNMLTLNKDTVVDTSVYGASIAGRVKASQFYVNQPDTRAPTTAGVYLGQNNATTGYFNINKGTGSGGFNFQTFNADGVTNKTNLSLNGSGSVQIPYYSTVTTDSQDSETTAMAVFDSTGNLVRSYQQNQRFRSVETRLNTLEGEVVASVPIKVNEIITRLNTLKIWNTKIANLSLSAPPAPFNPSPATTTAAVQVQLALSVSLATAQDPAWQTSFINAVATNLGISPSRIVISSVSLTATVYSASYKHLTVKKAYTAAAAGSVFVNVVVNPDPTGASTITPALAASTIVAKAQDPSSDLAAAVASTGATVDTGYVPAQKPSATATPAPTQPPVTYYDIDTSSPSAITFNSNATVEVFMIGGGGGGGAYYGGGGGAGSYYYTNGNTISVVSGTTWSIVVGDGGAGGITTTTSATVGGDTYIQSNGTDVLRVKGGGGGGSYSDGISVGPKAGGCGGGGQGYNAINTSALTIKGGAGKSLLTNGLVTYHPLSGNVLDPSNSTPTAFALKDSITNTALTVYGPISYYTSGLFSAVNFVNTAGDTNMANDGSRTIRYLRQSISLYPSSRSFTVSCWFNAQTLPASNFSNIFTLGTSSVTSFHCVIKDTNKLNINGYSISNAPFSFGNQTVTSNTWYHVAVTYSYNGTCTLYLNNSSIATLTGTGILQDNIDTLTFSSLCHVPYAAFNGYLSDFRIYNRILSTSEISQLYTLYNPLNVYAAYPGGDGYDDNGGYYIGAGGGGISGPGLQAVTAGATGGWGKAITWNGTEMGFGCGGGGGSNWIAGTGGKVMVNSTAVVLGGNSSASVGGNATANTGSGGAGGGTNTATSIAGDWYQVQYPASFILTSYQIGSRYNLNTSAGQNRTAKNFSVIGSNDGTNWYLVDSQTNQNSWYNDSLNTFTVSNNSTSYSYYRFIMTKMNVSEWPVWDICNINAYAGANMWPPTQVTNATWTTGASSSTGSVSGQSYGNGNYILSTSATGGNVYVMYANILGKTAPSNSSTPNTEIADCGMNYIGTYYTYGGNASTYGNYTGSNTTSLVTANGGSGAGGRCLLKITSSSTPSKVAMTTLITPSSTLQTLNTNSDSTVTTTGTAPNVIYQISRGIAARGSTIYSQNPLATYNQFILSFQMRITDPSGNTPTGATTGDATFIYIGTTAAKASSYPYVSLPAQVNPALFINFQLWNDPTAADHAETGTHLTLWNPTNSSVSYVDNITGAGLTHMNGEWNTVQLVYRKGTTNTWNLYMNGVSVIQYSDSNNAAWGAQAGNYWGIGSNNGGFQNNTYIRRMSLQYLP